MTKRGRRWLIVLGGLALAELASVAVLGGWVVSSPIPKAVCDTLVYKQ